MGRNSRRGINVTNYKERYTLDQKDSVDDHDPKDITEQYQLKVVSMIGLLQKYNQQVHDQR